MLRTALAALCCACACAAHAQEDNPAPAHDGETQAQIELSPVVVYGNRAASPIESQSSVDLLGLPREQLPYSFYAVSADGMADRGDTRVGDLADAVPGVEHLDDGSHGQSDEVLIRGFRVPYVFVNRVRRITGDETYSQTFNIDRYEVIEGASDVELGVAGPSGGINLVTKKPLFQPQLQVEGGANTQGGYRGMFDSTGPLDNSRDLAYRVIVGGDGGDSYRVNIHTRQLQFAPSLAWRYAPGAQLLLEAEYDYADTPWDDGVFYLEGAGLKNNFAPRGFSYADPDDYNRNIRKRVALYEVQPLGAGLTARLTAEYWQSRFHVSSYSAFPDSIYANGLDTPPYTYSGNPVINRSQIAEVSPTNPTVTLQPDIVGRWVSGLFTHSAALGLELQRTSAGNTFYSTGLEKPLNVLHPNYGEASFESSGDAFGSTTQFRVETRAAFGQYNLDVGSRLHILGGLRVDDTTLKDAEADYTEQGGAAPDGFTADFGDTALTYRGGASYDFLPGAVAYGDWSTAAYPQLGFDRDGNKFGPKRTEGPELGLRYAAENRLFGSLAVYQLTQKDIAEPDPHNAPGEQFEALVGEIKSRGLEGRGEWLVLAPWRLSAAFAWTWARVVSDTQGLQGLKEYDVAPLSANFSSRLDLSRWVYPGLSWVAQGRYAAHSPGEQGNTYQLPGYAVFDTGLQLKWRRHWQFDAVLSNLLDRTYYESSGNTVYNIYPGEPRTFMFQARYSI